MFGQQPGLGLQRDPELRADVRRQRQFLCRREFARSTTAVRVDPGITGQPPSNPRLVDLSEADLEDHW